MHYATQLDRQHAIRKRAAHRIVARCLRGPRGDELLRLAREALAETEARVGDPPYVRSWRTLLELSKEEIAREIVRRDDNVETMRESSPFFRVFGFDLGHRTRIVLKEDATRSRLWNIAKRVARMGTSERRFVHGCDSAEHSPARPRPGR